MVWLTIQGVFLGGSESRTKVHEKNLANCLVGPGAVAA